MVNYPWLRARLLSSLLIIFMPFAALANVLHRAVEPAQVLLDITLHNNDLTLFLSMPSAIMPWVSAEDTPQTLVEDLRKPVKHWGINNKAKCSALNRRIFLTDRDIQVVYEFACLAPNRLEQIRPKLQALLPGLKQINTWVSTDSSQNKQVVPIPGGIIKLPAPGK